MARRSCVIVLLVALFLAGCGYRLTGWRAPPSVRTIAIPTFDNKTFPLRRDIEFDLTSAVRKEFQVRTPLRLVSRETADLVLLGVIADFHERVAAEDRLDRKIESNLHVVVQLTVEDYRNRTSWRQEVDVVEPFSIEAGESVEIARRSAIGNLAEKIVLAVETW